MVARIFIQGAAASPPLLVVYAPLISAFSVVLVGLLAGAISWRQWIIARTKLQFDLYEKRLPIYKSVRDFLTTTAFARKLDDEQINKFNASIQEVRFLFDIEVRDYVYEIRERAVKYIEANEDLELARSSDDDDALEALDSAMDQRREYRAWLREQGAQVEEYFAPYLQIEDRGSKVVMKIGSILLNSISKIDFSIPK